MVPHFIPTKEEPSSRTMVVFIKSSKAGKLSCDEIFILYLLIFNKLLNAIFRQTDSTNQEESRHSVDNLYDRKSTFLLFQSRFYFDAL